ncbi:MAG TPA: glycoside hydrolase family 78 protein [Candidatus Protoclostridium stercorigallinarum]|uniref:alpha-L-rhamnosidase n=1 Tax=Candidatus Protoclostridium stercorigallinarum TaxID=2838741 RepID=A0A9D1Q131_9FIRM|nr:glycoside hydrolase family 78 protein [Candidatus Protoclostridium stercorigallinarum]
MLEITDLSTENMTAGCVTDRAHPRFSFALLSDKKGVSLASATVTVEKDGKRVFYTETDSQRVEYAGEPLAPFSRYTVRVVATDNGGESAEAVTEFETGRMGTPWKAEWISDPNYKFTEKRVSPVPMEFFREFTTEELPVKAVARVTAMGIFELKVNGEKAGEDCFAPGFTSYKTRLQYMTYDVTPLLKKGGNTLDVVVAGGWAVGSFVFTRKNRVTADRQALLLELTLSYADGRERVIGTDDSWRVTEEGAYRMADLYDGETYDARRSVRPAEMRCAAPEKLRVSPSILACYGPPVRRHETLRPISVTANGDERIYDFGQNFAGVICAVLKNTTAGSVVTFRHAEVLKENGELNTEILRSAKATATYVCGGGEREEYTPRFTYMGFRYVGVRGIAEEDIELTARALYSDIPNGGSFRCSDERLNKLQSNILWGARSNFVDIPTDCPQRDERMGWTGDINVFSQTAICNFDMTRFLEKWLLDVKSEQKRGGGIPNTVPAQGYGFPATMPVMAVDFWGDACVTVPWALYRATGDAAMLAELYPTMKKYVRACKFWAGIGFGKKRYIWYTPAVLHFGDWVCPDLPKMSQWQKRSRWTATASLYRTSSLLSRIARILGDEKEAERQSAYAKKVADAYVSVFTDGAGKLKNEFQTAYVLPLYFGMFPESQRKAAADNLARLAEENGWRIGTGFPGTPYILFALADNGRADAAYNMLMCEECPSWLYEVKAGGTTIWERWDAISPSGGNTGAGDGTGGMVSFNHYASGAVGDFFYRRIAGIEPNEAGYKAFTVRPVTGGGLTSASAELATPYGKIKSEWTKSEKTFTLRVSVPVSTECTVVLPSGRTEKTGSGEYVFTEES